MTNKESKERVLRNARILRMSANFIDESIRRKEGIGPEHMVLLQQFYRDIAADLERAYT